MKKIINNILIIITSLLIVLNTILKFNYFALITSLILLVIIIISNIKFKKKYALLFDLITMIITSLSIVSKSFNGNGTIMLLLFMLIITLAIMIKTGLKFEISLPIGISLLLIVFIVFGILNLLKISIILLIIISIFCIYYLYINKNKLKKIINEINYTSFVFFIILFIISILASRGRYVHKWDEYSYWAYASKVLIKTGSFKEFMTYMGTMSSYPPLSSVWHYIVSIFSGYSEQNLYFGLMVLDFVYMMPVFVITNKKKKFSNILLLIACFGFPFLLNGSINYGLLYVDLLLGMMTACTLITYDYLNEHKKDWKLVLLFLFTIVLLKPNGFVLSECLLLLFFLRELFSKKSNFKIVFKTFLKYLLPVVGIVLIYFVWVLLSNFIYDNSNSYIYKLIPASLSTDLSAKLNLTFLLNFFNGVFASIDETIIYSFIGIPLFGFLMFIFITIYGIDKKNGIKRIIPFVVFYIVFYILTAISLFVMFTYYEASKLASFSRYLNPIHIALMIYVLYELYKTSNDKKIFNIICIIIICLIGFCNSTFFITDIKTRREQMHQSEERINTFSYVTKNTKKTDKVFIINQTDEESIMPIWYARYYCFPRVVNANPNAITWKIKTKKNKEDLQNWGLTKDTFIEHLINFKFDYVFFYSSDKELYKELEQYFDNYELAKKSKLFKVENNKGLITLKAIKE